MAARQGARGGALRLGGLGGDELDQHVDGEQILDVLDLGIFGKTVDVGVRQPFTQLRQAILGHATVDGQAVSLGREVLGEQLAALDLDVEFLFEVEDDVEKVDRLGSKVSDKSR